MEQATALRSGGYQWMDVVWMWMCGGGCVIVNDMA